MLADKVHGCHLAGGARGLTWSGSGRMGLGWGGVSCIRFEEGEVEEVGS